MTIDTRFWINLLWLLVAVVWIATAASLKPIERIQPPRMRLLQTSLLGFAAVLMFTGFLTSDLLRLQVLPKVPAVEALGTALTAAGAAFAIAARAYLGTNWSGSATIKHSHELIRSGPYALVRHPIYFGLLIAASGTAIAYGEVRHWLAVLVILIAFRLKQINEERLLMETFGTEYREYARVVKWAILPFVL